jgi:hypothetical protein
MIPVVGGITEAATDFGDGDAVSGALDILSAASGVADMVVNPLAALASWLVQIAMEYIPPVNWLLDQLLGNPDAVAGLKTTWDSIAGTMNDASTSISSIASSLSSDWGGDSGQAAEQMLQSIAKIDKECATSCTNVGAGMVTTSAVIKAVRSLIESVLSEIIGMFISWGIEVACTVGLGTPFVAGQAAVEVPTEVGKATSWGSKVVNVVTKLASKLSGFISKLGGTPGKIGKIARDIAETLNNPLDKFVGKDLYAKSDVVKVLVSTLTGIDDEKIPTLGNLLKAATPSVGQMAEATNSGLKQAGGTD